MTPSTSAGQYSPELRDYARIELSLAKQVAYRKAHPEVFADRSKGHLSEAEQAALANLPPISDSEVDTWLMQYAQPSKPSGVKARIHPATYNRSSSYSVGARAAAVLAAGILSFSGVSTAYEGSAIVPQYRTVQTDLNTVKDAAALAALGFAGVSMGKASGRVTKEDHNRKSFWAKYK